MKRLAFLACTCAALTLSGCGPQPTTYANPELGLTLSYPADWKTIDRATMTKGVEHVKGRLPTEGVAEAMDAIVFGIGKPMDSGNPNLIVMKVPVSAAQCEGVNQPAFEAAESKEYLASLPGARMASPRHVSVQGLRGYSTEFRLEDRLFLQHRYWSCKGGKAMVMQSTSSSPKAEEELRKILASIRVARD